MKQSGEYHNIPQPPEKDAWSGSPEANGWSNFPPFAGDNVEQSPNLTKMTDLEEIHDLAC